MGYRALPGRIEVNGGLGGREVSPKYVEAVRAFCGCRVYVTEFWTEECGETRDLFRSATVRLSNGDRVSARCEDMLGMWAGEERRGCWAGFEYGGAGLELHVLFPGRGRVARCHVRWDGLGRGEGDFIKLWLPSGAVSFVEGGVPST